MNTEFRNNQKLSPENRGKRRFRITTFVKNWCMKVLVILLTMVLIASCTITKQRYSRGFHVEWRTSVKSGEKQSVSVQPVSTAKKEATLIVDSMVVSEENKSFSTVMDEKPQKAYDIQTLLLKPRSPVLKTEKTARKKEVKKPIQAIKQTEAKSKAHSGFDSFVAGIVGVLVLWFIIPPLIHTLFMNWDKDLPDRFLWLIIVDWMIWIGGIVVFFLFIPNGWLIAGSWILWNILFMILGFVIGDKLP